MHTLLFIVFIVIYLTCRYVFQFYTEIKHALSTGIRKPQVDVQVRSAVFLGLKSEFISYTTETQTYSVELPSARKKSEEGREMLTAVDEGLKIARNSHKLHLRTSRIIHILYNYFCLFRNP